MEHFLQSREWEEFQKSIGRKVRRIDSILAIKMCLGLGKSYLYCGGVSEPGEDFKLKIEDLRNELSAFAKNEGVIFLKFEPLTESKNLTELLLSCGFKKSGKHLQPQRTIVLDIREGEKELLAKMHKKTRYNIRLAGRHSLKFSIILPAGGPPQGDNFQVSSNSQKLEEFWTLLQKTAKRDIFHTHAKEYYEKLLQMPLANLFGVEYKDKLIAASIILFYGEKAYYLHGASDYNFRNLMAPYLLHWEAIKYAKSKGFKEYDFWGIDEVRWPGVTRFKRGFGGKGICYIGSYDYVFQPLWYRAYEIQARLRRK